MVGKCFVLQMDLKVLKEIFIATHFFYYKAIYWSVFQSNK